MDLKLAAALSAVGVVAAGTAAMAVNTQVLTSSSGSPVGSASVPSSVSQDPEEVAATPRPTVTRVVTTLVTLPPAEPVALSGAQSQEGTDAKPTRASGPRDDGSGSHRTRTHSTARGSDDDHGDDDHASPRASRSHDDDDDDEYESEDPHEHETESPEPSESEHDEGDDDHGGDDD